MGAGGDETVLVGRVVNPVGDAIGSGELVESFNPNGLMFVVNLLQLTSLLSEDLVLSLVEVVVAICDRVVVVVTDEAVFVVVVALAGGGAAGVPACGAGGGGLGGSRSGTGA